MHIFAIIYYIFYQKMEKKSLQLHFLYINTELKWLMFSFHEK